MQEEVTLKPTAEFFSMILYNSDPNSKVWFHASEAVYNYVCPSANA